MTTPENVGFSFETSTPELQAVDRGCVASMFFETQPPTGFTASFLEHTLQRPMSRQMGYTNEVRITDALVDQKRKVFEITVGRGNNEQDMVQAECTIVTAALEKIISCEKLSVQEMHDKIAAASATYRDPNTLEKALVDIKRKARKGKI